MPRYFFHTRYKSYSPDDEGMELADLDSAWKQATQTVGHILRDLDGQLEPGREWRMEVTDENGKMRFALHFAANLYDD